MLRIVPLLFAAGAVAVTFRIARRCCGTAAGYLAVVVLVTSVPVFNFAAQIRGYSLSMLLVVLMLDNLLRLEEAPRWRSAIVAAAAGALALYAIPSNLYILGSLGDLLRWSGTVAGGTWRAALIRC